MVKHLIGSQSKWESAASSGNATDTYLITNNFTFTSTPSVITLQSGGLLHGMGYIITIDASIPYTGLIDLDGGSINNVQIQLNTILLYSTIVDPYAGGSGGIVRGFTTETQRAGGTITNCRVIGFSSAIEAHRFGGIIGRFYTVSSSGSLTIQNCLVGMSVQGTAANVCECGGILGPDFKNLSGASVNINFCYVTGSTDGDINDGFFSTTNDVNRPVVGVGGIVGIRSTGFIIINSCYSHVLPLGYEFGSSAESGCGGIFGGINAGSTHEINNAWISGEFSPAFDNGAIQGDSGTYSGTVIFTNPSETLYDINGSANGADFVQPSDTTDIATYAGAGTNLPTEWNTLVWGRNSGLPYIKLYQTGDWDATQYITAYDHALLIQGACVARGTLISTPTGLVPIESLKVGDEVMTGDGRVVKVEGIHNWNHNGKNPKHHARIIPSGYFGNKLPLMNLYIHEDHAILFNNKWFHVGHHQDNFQQNIGPIEYFHLKLPDYVNDTYIANGLVVEAWDGRSPLEAAKANAKYFWKCVNHVCRKLEVPL